MGTEREALAIALSLITLHPMFSLSDELERKVAHERDTRFTRRPGGEARD